MSLALVILVLTGIIVSQTTASPASDTFDIERRPFYFPTDDDPSAPSNQLEPSINIDPRRKSCRCGRTHSNRIVGGTKAESGEWCWQAKLMIWKRGPHTSLFLCGGSVINDQYILSAAHCFYGMEDHTVDVYLGAYKLFRDTEGKKFSVESITIHPNYKPLTKANDIAIIKLTKKIEYNDRICSVCLPTKNEDYTGEPAIVTGWGALKSGGDSPESLMEAQVNIISYQRCKRSYGYLQPSQMCASAPGTDSCQGDSGGPLVHKSTEGFWELIGIVSAGRGCADKHYPGLYTNVYMFLPWIYEITSEDGYCPSK